MPIEYLNNWRHFSLLDEEGENVFNNGSSMGSPILNQAIAGCLATMADSMAIFAPNINSYRRMVPGCYAPLAPNWGYENRTTAIRIPGGDQRAMRIEHRVAGADAGHTDRLQRDSHSRTRKSRRSQVRGGHVGSSGAQQLVVGH